MSGHSVNQIVSTILIISALVLVGHVIGKRLAKRESLDTVLLLR